MDINFNPSELKILIVDDHPQIRKAMVRAIDRIDFKEILEAGNTATAIQILREQPVDLVILDLYLPDGSGFDVLEHIRNRNIDADIPVLVVTGEASKEEIVKAADVGANDYLLKPFKAEDFQNKIISLANKFANPTHVERIRRRAERCFMNKKFNDALILVEECITMEPENVSYRHLKGITLDKMGHRNEALEILNENIEINDNYYRTYAALAEIFLKEGRPNEAIEEMIRELELNPKQPRRQSQVATLLLKQGRIEDAVVHFREALKENSKYKLGLFGMGKAYAMMGNLEKSIYYYKRVRRYYPDNTKCLEAIVKVCLDANELKRAEYALKDEKNANKNRLDTYIILSKLYLHTDERDKAMSTVDEVLAKETEHIPALKLKAAIHMRYDEFQPAIDIYELLVEMCKDSTTQLQYADVHIASKQLLKAIAILHDALAQKDCQTVKILARLATCYARTHQYAKADYSLRRLARIQKLDPPILKIADKCRNALKSRRIQAAKRVAS